MDIILFSTADWDEPYWTNKQHVTFELAKLGHRILYVESLGLRAPKLGDRKDWGRVLSRLKGWLSPIKKRNENIWVFSPIQFPFFRGWPPVAALNRQGVSLLVKHFLRKNAFHDCILWTYHPFLDGIEDCLPWKRFVYHSVDDLGALPFISREKYDRSERAMLEKVDIVFVTARELESRLKPSHGNVHFMPNVVDFEHFSKAFDEATKIPEDLASIPEPRIGYIGVLSDFKVDFNLLIEVFRTAPDLNLVLIGDEREGQGSDLLKELVKLENVFHLGYRSYSELPGYLKGMDVGLLPTKINDYTKSMFPMKYFEYLAAGVPVVSTRLDFTESVTEGIIVATEFVPFRDAIRKQVHDIPSFENAKGRVAGNTWRARTLRMIELSEQSS
ncbi:MAG: glycosyltransferase [Verrucomicrobiales bacterium]|nr:glycosyltransferase [Verrucomicrobiales bacterium]